MLSGWAMAPVQECDDVSEPLLDCDGVLAVVLVGLHLCWGNVARLAVREQVGDDEP